MVGVGGEVGSFAVEIVVVVVAQSHQGGPRDQSRSLLRRHDYSVAVVVVKC